MVNASWLVTVFCASSILLCTSHADVINYTELSDKCRNAERHKIFLFPGLMTQLELSGLKNYTGTIEVHFKSNRESFAVQYNPENYPSISLYGQEGTNSTVCLKKHTKGDHHFLLNITLYYCPPGFVLSSQGMCVCPVKLNNPEIACNQVSRKSGIMLGFCATRGRGNKPLLITRCAYANHLIKPLLPITQNNTTGETQFCHVFNRQGTLCNECIQDHALSVYSDTFDCIPCKSFEVKTLLLYLTIELLPTTVFVLLLLFFHIGITSGGANGFVFFAQMITTPLEVLFLTYGLQLYVPDNKTFATVLAQFIISPYCIWNLDFFRIVNHKICLSPDLDVLQVVALRYILALYPLLLLGVTYIVIELKARNIRVITWLWMLVCFSCVRWRRVWKAKTSVIDAFASCVLLSYNRIVLVSLYYLTYSAVRDNTGKYVGKVLAFDTSAHYMGNKHKPYMIIAIMILITFGAFPLIILTFYQFKPFQHCLQRLRMQTVGLKQFVQAFQGCYRDGTDGKLDCRFFAGVYFMFRCIILIIMSVAPSFPTGFTSIIVVSAVFLLLFAIFQPYKEKIHNVIDSSMIFLFGAVTTIQMYIYNYLQQTLKVSHTFLLYYILLYLPLIYIKVYVGKWIYCHWNQRHNRLCTPNSINTDFFRDSILDEREERDGVDSSDRNRANKREPSHSEVSIVRLSREDSSNEEASERLTDIEEEGTERMIDTSYDEVRQKPHNERERLLRDHPMMPYGSIQ